jgi:hypothetical protein
MKEEIRDIYEHSRTANGARRKFQKWMRTASLFYQKSGWCSESVETSLNETPKFKAIDK